MDILEIPDDWHMKVAGLSALNCLEISQTLISFRGRVDPRAIVRPEGLSHPIPKGYTAGLGTKPNRKLPPPPRKESQSVIQYQITLNSALAKVIFQKFIFYNSLMKLVSVFSLVHKI